MPLDLVTPMHTITGRYSNEARRVRRADRHRLVILIVTNRGDLTADGLILELERRGSRFYRSNTEDYPERLHLRWELGSGPVSSASRREMMGPPADVPNLWSNRLLRHLAEPTCVRTRSRCRSPNRTLG